MMTNTTVAMINIAQNIQSILVFMDFEINGTRYPKEPKTNNVLLKLLAPNPFSIGLVSLNDDRISLIDENDDLIAQFSTSEIKNLELGAYRSVVRAAPLVAPQSRYVAAILLTTATATYHILNDDLHAVVPFITATNISPEKVTDELNLLANKDKLQDMDNDTFEQLSHGTKYFAPLQSIGSNERL